MKQVIFPIALVLFVLCSCKEEATPTPKDMWPSIEQSLKLYAEQKGGLYCLKGSGGASAYCEILVPCKEHKLGIPELMEDVIEASGGKVIGRGGVSSDAFFSKEVKGGVYLRVTDLNENESWFELVDGDSRWHMQVRGRVICEVEKKKTDIGDGKRYKTIGGGDRPEGAMFWLKINYISQNSAKAKD